MSGNRRRRGSGGHPARVAKRRRRDDAAQSGGPALASTARQIARTTAAIDSALELELWCSQMLGMFWQGRYELPLAHGAGIDPALEYGEPLLREMARIDEPGAALAVLAIAELEEGELGMQARDLLDSLGMRRRLPAWAADVGESEIIGAAVMRDPVFDDAETVFLESRHADGQVLAVGVLIAKDLGGIAKDVLLADSIELVEEVMRAQPPGDDHGQLVFERVAPGVAAGLVGAAISETDATWDPPVNEDYWRGRALALLRADQTSDVVTPEERSELSDSERAALHEQFLASAEGAAFSHDGDEAWVATLAIDFADGYLGRDPLRWSPTVAELFMLDWVPRKVLATRELLDVLPGALDAWVRFAGRRCGQPEAAVELVRAAIAEFSKELVARASDPEFAGSGKQLLMAAQEAGVDVEDPAALGRLVADWNAREGSGGSAALGRRPGVGPGGQSGESLLQVKITLKGVTKPPVWRRLRLSAGTALDELHQIIQTAFGWEDCHLHMFEVGGEDFGPSDPDLELDCADERGFTLGELAGDVGDRLTYTYDFGDDWRHELVVEKVLAPEPGGVGAELLAAKGACPPEDCGGVWGYQRLKAVLADPDDEEHEALREWLSQWDAEAFDPVAVDAEAIRAALADAH